MALKFLGTSDANELSPLTQDLMADTGVAVSSDFGCFELPVFDLESGNPVGIGVDCLNIFDGDDSGAMIEAITFFSCPADRWSVTDAQAFVRSGQVWVIPASLI